MNQKPEYVKSKLDSILKEMSDLSWMFVNDPKRDFTRENSGKLSFYNTMRLILSMEKGTCSDEIIKYFQMNADAIPSQSALIQRRHQINSDAFPHLFKKFSSAFPQTTHDFKDHCILACDGTHVVYATNAEIIEDFNKPRMVEHKGYNHMHLNALVDSISKAFLDVVIQPGQKPDERAALHTMIDHFKPDDPESYIITADRGYESYDLLFHLKLRGFSYVLRAKSPDSDKSLLSSFIKDLPLDKDEFDVTIERFFTDKKTKEMKERPHVYHYMNPNKNIPHFLPLLNKRHLVYLAFRVVKLKAPDGSTEFLITNLPSSFDMEDIRECYHWRWGCEISFRYLKHAASLLYFHSKLPEFLLQEIYATLVMYNFGVFLANEAANEYHNKHKPKPDNKYKYTIDFSTALRNARSYFLSKENEKPIDIIRILCRFVHAIKDKYRKFARPLRGIGAIRFNYR